MYLYPPLSLSRFSPSNFAGCFNNRARRRHGRGNARKVALTLSSLEELSFVASSWSCESVIAAQQRKPGLLLQLHTANGHSFINEKVGGKENLSRSVTRVPKPTTLFFFFFF